jgi:hypothetical protein
VEADYNNRARAATRQIRALLATPVSQARMTVGLALEHDAYPVTIVKAVISTHVEVGRGADLLDETLVIGYCPVMVETVETEIASALHHRVAPAHHVDLALADLVLQTDGIHQESLTDVRTFKVAFKFKVTTP